MPRLVEQARQWLEKLQRFGEKTYQYWSVARVLIESGYDELRQPFHASMEQTVEQLSTSFHADGFGGLHHAIWFAQREQRHDLLERICAMVDELRRRRPRLGEVMASSGFTDDPLGEGTDEPLDFRLLTSGYGTVTWTETVRYHGGIMAAMAAATEDAAYFQECERHRGARRATRTCDPTA